VTADRLTSDRVGCPRSDEQQAGQGLVSPLARPKEVTTKRNTRAAVEMTLLWKSQNDSHRSLEISHRTRDSHIPTSRSSFLSGRRT
jgi:hypothetical protein